MHMISYMIMFNKLYDSLCVHVNFYCNDVIVVIMSNKLCIKMKECLDVKVFIVEAEA